MLCTDEQHEFRLTLRVRPRGWGLACWRCLLYSVPPTHAAPADVPAP